MPNSVDFRADQIQTKQIIVTGSGAGTTKLLIYGIEAQGSPVNEGVVNTTIFPTGSIGSDVFLYVSGALNTKGSATVRGTSVFGGDLVVSGSLYNGLVTVSGGFYSHAEGNSTIASGNFSHAEGNSTIASGSYSHAEGYLTVAFGTGSHASGNGTIASGSVDGAALSATSILQTATGRFNKRNNTTSLFVVGNGTGDSDALRGDIFRAESTGGLVLSGGIRHAIKVVNSFATPTTNMTRSDYLVLVQTSGNATVVLPEITDTVTDLGLTVEIRQMDGALSTRTVTIQPHANNSTYLIRGFDAESFTLVLGSAPAGTNTNRSVALTFMGIGTGIFNKWVVIATSTC